VVTRSSPRRSAIGLFTWHDIEERQFRHPFIFNTQISSARRPALLVHVGQKLADIRCRTIEWERLDSRHSRPSQKDQEWQFSAVFPVADPRTDPSTAVY
jgi:hypothetical protein